jgi:hypothetical protein
MTKPFHQFAYGNTGIEYGETGPDWEPTDATRYYAQRGKVFEFGPTPEAAIAKLLQSEGTSPIYELPTRSARKYRGKYPERVHSLSLGSTCHIELNNGRRFVALSRFVIDRPRLGDHVSKVFKPIGPIPVMSWADYAGVLFITQTVRALRR